MNSWHHIGAHRYCAEESLFLWEPHGAMSPEECRQFLAALDAVGARTKPLFVVLDQRAAAPASADVRRLVVEYLREVRPTVFCAFVGSPVMQRALNQLIISAARLLYGYELRNAQYASVEVALAELRKMRDRLSIASAS